ncbi:MAG: hypothetical protein H0W88_00600 [Parachlamydiaceae bacterium]|nr:hypothetical protein [Parachlamydiaceae bacterium]
MLNITNREFSSDIWNQMVIDAANSRKNDGECKNICRVIYPTGICTLELKTDKQIKEFFQQKGSWNGNCVKMQLRDVLNLTRIGSLNEPVNPQIKDSIKESVLFIASRAEAKYNNGFKGVIRKIISIFFNLFVTDSVDLFGMASANVAFQVVKSDKRNKLPGFIGNDANFARLINSTLFS